MITQYHHVEDFFHCRVNNKDAPKNHNDTVEIKIPLNYIWKTNIENCVMKRMNKFHDYIQQNDA